MELLEQVEAAAQTRTPEERAAKLRVLRDDAEAILGRIDTYLGDDALRRDAEAMGGDARLAMARGNASLREALLARGALASDLDEAGMLSHENLDMLIEEGLIEAALEEIAPLSEAVFGLRAKFDKNLHPHGRGGLFRETFGHVFAKKSGHGPKVKGRTGTVSHPTPHGVPAPKVEKLPEPPKTPKAPEPDRPHEPAKPKGPPTPEGVDRLQVPEPKERVKGQTEANKEKVESLRQKIDRRIRMAASGRRLATAEAHFNPAGSVSQHTLCNFARDGASKPDTLERYSREGANGKRIWHPARRRLHEAIIDALLREPDLIDGDLHMNPDNPYLEPDPDGHPKMLASGGGYSAGKGGSIKRLRAEGREPKGALTLDPDRIKAMLPEFQDALDNDDPEGNLAVYREAWEIAQEVQRRAIEKKLNVVVDGVSDTDVNEVWARQKEFADQGYDVQMVYTDIPTEEALKRAAGRAVKAKADSDRRHIPEVIMRAVHRDVAATIPALIARAQEAAARGEKVPSIEVFDNNQGWDAENDRPIPPKRYVHLASDGTLTIEDEELWKTLQAKGHEKIKGVDDAELVPPPGDTEVPDEAL